jgi:hypothetical protein
MIAVPIGPRFQRFASAAAPAYLDRRGRPQHPRDLLRHGCLRGRFSSGAMAAWEFERDSEVVRVDPTGPLIVSAGTATDLAVDAAVAGPASSICSRNGCVRILIAARSNRSSNRGGFGFRDRSSTTRADGWCRRRCAPLSTSSRLCRPTAPETRRVRPKSYC